MARTNLHIYPSPLANETRIVKITDWLDQKRVFDRIFVAGIAAHRLPNVQKTGKHRIFVRLQRGGSANSFWLYKAVGFLPWFGYALALMLRLRPSCINAHSLTVLPVAVLGKWLCGAKLVYDTHELETEVFTAAGPRKKILKLVERLLIPFVDQTVVVSEGIADWYQTAYGIPKPHILRNIPSTSIELKRGTLLREKFAIPPEDIIALYLGIVAKGREVEKIIDMWHEAPLHWHLVIVGFGALFEELKQRSTGSTNIHFHNAVPIQQVVPLAASADIGLCFFDPGCLSHYYSLPNKFFECLCAGVPVVSNDLPERTRIIRKENCGWIIPLDRMRDIFALTRDEIAAKAPAARLAAQHNPWSSETAVLENVYGSLGFYKKQIP